MPDHKHHHHPHEGHGIGHNHAHDDADHLHSHLHGSSDEDRIAELQVLATSFIEGFRSAADKTSYLRLSGIPFQRPGSDGLTLNLVDANINCNWQVGTASPAFGSRELVYMPFPGSMISERESMTFTYVSLTERADIDLLTLLETHLDTPKEGHHHEH